MDPKLHAFVDMIRGMAYPLMATLGCILLGLLFAMLEAVANRLQELADPQRRAAQLAAALLNNPAYR